MTDLGEEDHSRALHYEGQQQVLPLFLRLCAPPKYAGVKVTSALPAATHRNSRKALADRLPFFLRLWWLRDQPGSKHFSGFTNQMITFPIGSQYSDPICDAGSADMAI